MKDVLVFIGAVIFLPPHQVWSQANVAKVESLRGQVFLIQAPQEPQSIVKDQIVNAGAVLKTAEKSFVRLKFLADSSLMNIGPSSEVKIEKASSKEAGVIDMVKGQIRAQVTPSKDYLKAEGKSKLFIKTPNAVMGVRGTDFLLNTNGINTSTVLFEGKIKLSELDKNDFSSPQDLIRPEVLEKLVDVGQEVRPGEFSVVNLNEPPLPPARLNIQQIEKLEKNVTFQPPNNQSIQQSPTAVQSIVPKGLSGEVVASSHETLKGELNKLVDGVDINSLERSSPTLEAPASIRPLDGAYLHLESGVVIAPPKDAIFDTNSQTFLPSSHVGFVSEEGSYRPPASIEITDQGKVIAQIGSQKVEIPIPSYTEGNPTHSLGDIVAAVSDFSTGKISSSGDLLNQIPPEMSKNILPILKKDYDGDSPRNSESGFVQLPPQLQQPIQPPTLCNNCGGFIPGSADTIAPFTRAKIDVVIP
jgi:hypothetical protein